MVQLVVNADDFGQTRGVCEGILEAHKNGILTSATLMPNGDAFETAVEIAKRNPSLGVGVHLNFVEGRPISPSREVRSLLDQSGRFLSKYGLLGRLCAGKLCVGELRHETEAQIDMVIGAGLQPTHVDAHKNIHAFPCFFAAVAQAACSRGIRAIRVPYEQGWLPEASRHPSGAVRTLLLNTAAAWSRRRLGAIPLSTTDRFAGTIRTGTIDACWLEAWLSRLGQTGSVELMVHPGKCDADLQALQTRLRKSREEELAALTDERVIRRVKELGIQLIHFGQLGAPATRTLAAALSRTPDGGNQDCSFG